MSNANKANKKRVGVSFRFDQKFLLRLRAASERTGLPMTRIIEKCVTRELNLK